MKKTALAAVLLALCLQILGAEATLRERWSTALDFKVPESVFFDTQAGCLYVSNINGGPGQKNGEGFLSKVDLSGQILELEWVKGLDAPKGMGVYGEELYVTDIDRVVVIDKNRGTILVVHSVPGAKFLNDIAVDRRGKVYISDSSGDAIYTLEGGRITKVLSGGRYLKGPNGLFWEGDALLIGVRSRILRWKPGNEELTVLVETTGGGNRRPAAHGRRGLPDQRLERHRPSGVSPGRGTDPGGCEGQEGQHRRFLLHPEEEPPGHPYLQRKPALVLRADAVRLRSQARRRYFQCR